MKKKEPKKELLGICNETLLTDRTPDGRLRVVFVCADVNSADALVGLGYVGVSRGRANANELAGALAGRDVVLVSEKGKDLLAEYGKRLERLVASLKAIQIDCVDDWSVSMELEDCNLDLRRMVQQAPYLIKEGKGSADAGEQPVRDSFITRVKDLSGRTIRIIDGRTDLERRAIESLFLFCGTDFSDEELERLVAQEIEDMLGCDEEHESNYMELSLEQKIYLVEKPARTDTGKIMDAFAYEHRAVKIPFGRYKGRTIEDCCYPLEDSSPNKVEARGYWLFMADKGNLRNELLDAFDRSGVLARAEEEKRANSKRYVAQWRSIREERIQEAKKYASKHIDFVPEEMEVI